MSDSTHIPYKALPAQGLSARHFRDESPLAGSPYYRPEVACTPRGVRGETLPYMAGRDNVIAGVLLLCFVLAALAVAFCRSFLLRHARNFFYAPRSEADAVETSTEVRFLSLLSLQTALLLGLLFYLFVRLQDKGQTMDDSQPLPIAVFSGIIVLYLAVKWLVYQVVDFTFFDKRSIAKWEHTRRFLTAVEGMLIFPMMVVQTYVGFELKITIIYTLFIVIFIKILTIYKAQTIFFKANTAFVQNILYFCALEMMPLGALWGILNVVQHYLKVNF